MDQGPQGNFGKTRRRQRSKLTTRNHLRCHTGCIQTSAIFVIRGSRRKAKQLIDGQLVICMETATFSVGGFQQMGVICNCVGYTGLLLLLRLGLLHASAKTHSIHGLLLLLLLLLLELLQHIDLLLEIVRVIWNIRHHILSIEVGILLLLRLSHNLGEQVRLELMIRSGRTHLLHSRRPLGVLRGLLLHRLLAHIGLAEFTRGGPTRNGTAALGR
mmetsp:Transcript_38899/g.80776  ORF Transcript_38899/g.80776 Transcript_38899/m.80776 type:complete len:215 (+) Transcript_38899:2316-2960(+)